MLIASTTSRMGSILVVITGNRSVVYFGVDHGLGLTFATSTVM
jgi:hypothetical protein